MCILSVLRPLKCPSKPQKSSQNNTRRLFTKYSDKVYNTVNLSGQTAGYEAPQKSTGIMIQKSNRSEILETAYWLFYEKGYNAASLEDIAGKCGVTKQAITYHFGSKQGLGREVSSLLAERNFRNFTKRIQALVGECQPDVLNAAHLIWFSHVYKHDEKAFRFFREFILVDDNFNDILQSVTPSYERIVEKGDLGPVDAVRQMQMLSAFYAGKGLLFQYSTGNLSCSEEMFEQYYFSNYYHMFYTNEEQKRLYKKGVETLKKAGMENLPYDLSEFM